MQQPEPFIGPSGRSRSSLQIDAVIHRLLATNDGAIARRTLTAAGIRRAAIARRIRSGALVELAPGVVGLPSPADVERQRVRAGLESQLDAVLGYETAAARHGLPIEKQAPTHLVVPHGRARTLATGERAGWRMHQTRLLRPVDIVEVDGFLATSVPRTLIDLAVRPRDRWLMWIYETAVKEALVSIVDLRACVLAHSRRGKSGIVRSRAIVDALIGDSDDAAPIDLSELELAFFRLVSPLAIAGLRAQFRPPWYDGWRGIVDFAIPEHRLVIELDGRRWHSLTQDQANDRARDRAARANGWSVLRYGWEEITRRPDDVVADLVVALGGADMPQLAA